MTHLPKRKWGEMTLGINFENKRIINNECGAGAAM